MPAAIRTGTVNPLERLDKAPQSGPWKRFSATTSTREKAELAQNAGADHVVEYDEFVDAVRRVTGERGADVVYDSVGKATFEDSLTALKVRGMLVHYATDRAELLWRARDLFDWIAKGELDVRIGGTYPLTEAGRAQADLDARRTAGKLLLLS